MASSSGVEVERTYVSPLSELFLFTDHFLDLFFGFQILPERVGECVKEGGREGV